MPRPRRGARRFEQKRTTEEGGEAFRPAPRPIAGAEKEGGAPEGLRGPGGRVYVEEILVPGRSRREDYFRPSASQAAL
ncbi:hypothetical protein GCM10010394_02220 [Streptomyces crystallinus]|uniref:Uncharacterized protein n=1 Tax=Streptomyces crystallinus TaxID=68191 RepID=A0ABP3PWL5_9ACTN